MRRRKRHIFRWVALGFAVAAAVPATAQAEPTPYQGQHQVRQPMELGLSEGKIRALGLVEQRATRSSDGRSYSIDVNAYTVTGFGVALFIAIAIGMGIVAVRHNRGTKLSPA